jgi:hypothetical protein
MRHGYAAAVPGSNVKFLALHLLAGRPGAGPSGEWARVLI